MTRVDASRGQGRSGGALVPLAADRPAIGAAPRLSPPRSPFLAQLSRQYESREEALQRRDAAREDAHRSYGGRPAGDPSRHIVWA